MKRLNLLWGALALIAVTLTATPVLNAQERENRDMNGNIVRGPYETNKFSDNWFVGVAGGVNLFWNEAYDVKIGPSIDGNFGKWFTPAIGMRIGYQGLNAQAWADQPGIPGAHGHTGPHQAGQNRHPGPVRGGGPCLRPEILRTDT